MKGPASWPRARIPNLPDGCSAGRSGITSFAPMATARSSSATGGCSWSARAPPPPASKPCSATPRGSTTRFRKRCSRRIGDSELLRDREDACHPDGGRPLHRAMISERNASKDTWLLRAGARPRRVRDFLSYPRERGRFQWLRRDRERVADRNVPREQPRSAGCDRVATGVGGDGDHRRLRERLL